MATDYHYLMGADDVKDASYRMQQAATDMTNAAANFDQTIMNARNWANDWLVQYEQIQKEVSMDDKKVKRNLNRFAMIVIAMLVLLIGLFIMLVKAGL